MLRRACAIKAGQHQQLTGNRTKITSIRTLNIESPWPLFKGVFSTAYLFSQHLIFFEALAKFFRSVSLAPRLKSKKWPARWSMGPGHLPSAIFLLLDKFALSASSEISCLLQLFVLFTKFYRNLREVHFPLSRVSARGKSVRTQDPDPRIL
jgi:hypothetical protein